MATPDCSVLRPSLRDAGNPASAEGHCRTPASPSPSPRDAAEPQPGLSSGLDAGSDAERSGEESRPEEPGESRTEGPGESRPEGPGESRPEGPGESRPEGPGESRPEGPGEIRPEGPGQLSAVSALLQRCVAEGAVSQETLHLTCRETPCFVKFSEMEKAANMQAEMNEIKLKTEIMQLENETADITNHFYLGKKCKILQDMNRHLEAVLKEKRALRKRLIKPRCQDSLPIEATFHKCIVQLLTEAVTFIEKLESHLQSVRSIPHIPNMMKNMDTALTKTEVLVMDLEELTEQILKWRELQKEVYSDSIWKSAELDFGLSLT